MSKKTFTTAYNRNENFTRDVSTVKFTHPSKVKESLSYAVDINTIYNNYCKTGNLPLNGQKPLYDENFVKYDSLIEAQKLVDEATQYFVGLPARIKNQYGNNLGKFIAALNKKDDFLVKEGVLNISSVNPAPEKEPVVDTPAVVSEPVNTATTD